MKILKLAIAFAVALGSLSIPAAPAAAQHRDRYEDRDRGYHRGDDRGYRRGDYRGRHRGDYRGRRNWRNNRRHRVRVCNTYWRHHRRHRECHYVWRRRWR